MAHGRVGHVGLQRHDRDGVDSGDDRRGGRRPGAASHRVSLRTLGSAGAVRRPIHRCWTVGRVSHSRHGLGTLRRLGLASCSILPTPPLSTVLLAASANPLTWLAVMLGGNDSAFGSVTRSNTAGPSWANTSRSPSWTSLGCSTRRACSPTPVAIAA